MTTPSNTDNLRVRELRPLIAPDLLIDEIPLSPAAFDTVNQGRQTAAKIISGDDDRLLMIVGPCSIHDPKAAIEYAKRLVELRAQYQDELCMIMRVYFEKPRTTVGWKGLINDPGLNNQFNINQGLRQARELLAEIADLGLPTATEFLDTIIPQYIADLISWAAIGARTTESQIHRELASGLSMPVGFKNGTGGSVQIAVDAIGSAQHSHHFLGVTNQGVAAIVSTAGNPHCHVILRGSKTGPNYDATAVAKATELLAKKQLTPKVMIDCSHGNSNKDYRRQQHVIEDVCAQLRMGSTAIQGVMVESHLVAGRQDAQPGQELVYGQSITDACIDWEETVALAKTLATAVQARRQMQSGETND